MLQKRQRCEFLQRGEGRRDLRRAKEAINERGDRRSESEADKIKDDNKLEKARETRNETRNTGETGKVDSEMRKGKEPCDGTEFVCKCKRKHDSSLLGTAALSDFV